MERKISLLGIYLTNFCNLQCEYCYLKDIHKTKKKYMTKNEFQKIINQFVKYKIKILGLTGGEPTVQWKTFIDILKSTKILNIDNLTIATNGLLLNGERLKEIKSLKIPKLGFLISLDSLQNSEVHDLMRGPNHSKVMDIIKLIEKNQMNYSISMVVHRNNFEEVQKFLAHSKELKMKQDWDIPPLILSQMIVSGGAKKILKLRLKAKQEKILDKIIQENWGDLTFDCCYAPFTSKEPSKFKELAGCPAGRYEFGIDPFGNLFPCVEISNMVSIGNVFENDFEKIIENSEIIKRFRNNEIGEPCKSCHFNTCKGGCRIMGSIFYNDLFAGLTFCNKN
ncbi:MAG: radical SAM protein [Candidatus Lokiarchaeota archaeon]|nr:radical SAM protein [Candidatus Lokiarchaeota archaeon]